MSLKFDNKSIIRLDVLNFAKPFSLFCSKIEREFCFSIYKFRLVAIYVRAVYMQFDKCISNWNIKIFNI